MNKKKLGQFYTTNYEYILSNMEIPDNVKTIVEPFVGNGDLLNFIKKTNMAIITIGILFFLLILMGVFDWNTSLNTYVLWGWISINLLVLIVVPDLWKRKRNFN